MTGCAMDITEKEMNRNAVKNAVKTEEGEDDVKSSCPL